MSIFNELLPNLIDISNLYSKNLNGHLKDALKSIDKFYEDFQSQYGRNKAREKAQRDKNAMITLQSIDEGEDEQNIISDSEPAKRISKTRSNSQSSNDKQRGPKKRSKHEVDDMSSPEQDKRVKRNASVKAQSIISKQVNVNLTQKLRREKSMDKSEPVRQSSRSRRHKDDKENLAPEEAPTIQIKQEKISLLEPMDTEAVNLPIDVEIKQERHKDDIAMPPPAAPVPKPRKGVPKEKSQDKPLEETSEEDLSRRNRRGTRNKKPTDVAPAPAPRSTRSSARGRDAEEPSAAEPAPEPEPRPKRTRGKKKLSQIRADSGNVTQSSTESLPASPADKPRPKRTRRAQKADKEEAKPVETELRISPKEERPSQEQISSPIIKPKNKKGMTTKELVKTNSTDKLTTQNIDKDLATTKITTDPKSKIIETELANTLDQVAVKSKSDKDLVKTKNGLVNNVEKLVTSVDQVDIALDESRVISKVSEMDRTVIIPNSVYNHAPLTPKNIQMNETVVLENAKIPDKLNGVMNAIVVLDKGPIPPNLTDDNSLITDDSDSEADIPNTPPKKGIPEIQPLSAVKEKVQQFEELATRVTRTKTRAMAKKEEDKDTETQTPPDKISKAVLSSDTLSKMNSLIFNGKPPQTSSSGCKPRAPASGCKLRAAPASASKASAVSRPRDSDDALRREDARQKKEALLEAKREQQKRKREEKMAAAAAARSAAERERRALLEAAARERGERQLHAELERGRAREEAERKKQELARKAAETEERRRAEETARQQRLAEEQRRAIELRIKKNEESEAMRREEARMAKEIERKQREYHEKQKKQKIDKMHTPFKPTLGKYPPLPPAYMEDGFQYLNSDEDADPPERPVPAWSTSKARRLRLGAQQLVRRRLVARWWGECARSPDLAEIFPGIERARLKRTSSAVWRTPPPPPPPPPRSD